MTQLLVGRQRPCSSSAADASLERWGASTSCPCSPVSSAHRGAWAPKPQHREIWDRSGVTRVQCPHGIPLPSPREQPGGPHSHGNLSRTLPEGEAVTRRAGAPHDQPRFPKSAELTGDPQRIPAPARAPGSPAAVCHTHTLCSGAGTARQQQQHRELPARRAWPRSASAPTAPTHRGCRARSPAQLRAGDGGTGSTILSCAPLQGSCSGAELSFPLTTSSAEPRSWRSCSSASSDSTNPWMQ